MNKYAEWLENPPERVTLYPAPILRERAKPVTDFGEELTEIAAQMVRKMREWHGVGLAGPQVGLPYQLMIVSNYPEGVLPHILVNPTIICYEGPQVALGEGCLSLPGIRGEVNRYLRVKFSAQDLSGTRKEYVKENYHARIFQHEYDHLYGRLVIDHFSWERRKEIVPLLEELEKTNGNTAN